MHSTRSPFKTGMISVYERVQCDHTLGRAPSADESAAYASVRNRPKTNAVWHHKLNDPCNTDEKCLLRGTNWVFK